MSKTTRAARAKRPGAAPVEGPLETALPETVRLFEPAEVVLVRGAEVEVQLGETRLSARLALAGAPSLAPGDLVLLAREQHEGGAYVIGVLRQLRDAEVVATAVDGATVRLRGAGEAQILSVHGPDGGVWFEHHPGEGRSVISAPFLEIRAETGHLDLHAAKKVRLHGEEGVELRSARAVSLGVVGSKGDAEAGAGAYFSVAKEGARLVADELLARLGRAEAKVDQEAHLQAEHLRTSAELVTTSARVISTTADRLVSKARESYAEVAELAQVRASQMRLVAEKTFRVLGERAIFKAKKDMKLKGETIYLD